MTAAHQIVEEPLSALQAEYLAAVRAPVPAGAVPRYFKVGHVKPPANSPPYFLRLAAAYAAAAEAFDRVREDAPEEIYHPACDAHHAALSALLRYSTTDHRLITFKRAVVEDDTDSNGRDLDQIIDGFMARPAPPPAPCRGPWDSTVTAYYAAKAEHDALLRENDRSLPPPPELRGRTVFGYANFVRWGGVEQLDSDILLDAGNKAALRPILLAYLAENDRLLKTPEGRAQADADEARHAISYDRMSVAENALLTMPAPDAAAIVEKQRLLAKWIDDDGFGFSDLGLVAAKRDHWRINCPDLVQHIDALSLAGIDDPILHLEPWCPRGWVNAFECLGGYVTDPVRSGLIIVFPERDHHGVASTLLAELAATPWKYRAIHHFAKERRSTGADPYFDAGGDYGAKDQRGSRRGKKPLPVPVPEALHIDWTCQNDLPVPHVEHIVNKAVAR